MKTIRSAFSYAWATIPWFFRVLGSAVYKFYYDDCFSRASSLAYTTLFALVPMCALTFSMFKGFAINEDEIYEPLLDQILPASQYASGSFGEAKQASEVAQQVAQFICELGAKQEISCAKDSLEQQIVDTITKLRQDGDGALNLRTLVGKVAAISADEGIAVSEERLEDFVGQILPIEYLRLQVGRWTKKLGEGVQATGVVSLGILLFIGIALINTIESALNVVWRVTSDQSVLAKVINFWAVISLGPLLVAFSFYWYSKFGIITDSDPAFAFKFFPLLNFVVPLVLIWFALALMFYKMPATRVNLRDAVLGAFIAAILFELMKRGFGWYVSNSMTYSSFYEVIVVIPLFFFWLYLIWVAVLFGAEVAYQAGSIKLLRGLSRYASELGEVGALLGLRILYVIGGRFVRGEEPPSESEIALESGSDPILVRTCLGILADAGMITSLDPNSHARTLRVHPEKISVGEVVRAFRSKRYRSLEELQSDEPSMQEVAFLEVIRTAALSDGDSRPVQEWTLMEFLRSGEQAAVEQ